ncbi:extensin family protein [Variovorax dokdonensis]|uniref:Extensin family protein n=1 Tax=Variovorax dokdonensis TaxID=344883 RepID=A0ABT7NF57_9BURK|nr:extensin family protein [Variovorax dokdonensis]MDM0046588.1 extensin family protein [Variovorax dokdonensis]
MLLRFAAALCFVALLALGWAVHAGWVVVPPRFNPWARLDISEPPNWLTRIKLGRAQREPAQCLALIGEAGMRFEPVPDRVTGEGCALENAVRLQGTNGAPLNAPVLLSCRVALPLALWERHVLQPAALQHLGTRITRIDHLGGYACRNVVTGRAPSEGGGRRSRHATADALDLAAFSRADRGRAVSLRRDWAEAPQGPSQASTPEAEFLRAIHQGACGLFEGVLGPDYNAVHADHFHLEVGGWRSCR